MNDGDRRFNQVVFSREKNNSQLYKDALTAKISNRKRRNSARKNRRKPPPKKIDIHSVGKLFRDAKNVREKSVRRKRRKFNLRFSSFENRKRSPRVDDGVRPRTGTHPHSVNQTDLGFRLGLLFRNNGEASVGSSNIARMHRSEP